MLNPNDVYFEVPSDDPWIPAHQNITSPEHNVTIYGPDFLVNLLGCVDQYQICNPNKGKGCTNLSGQKAALHQIGLSGNAADLNEHQTWAALRIMENALSMSLYMAVQGRGATALNGQSYLCFWYRIRQLLKFYHSNLFHHDRSLCSSILASERK